MPLASEILFDLRRTLFGTPGEPAVLADNSGITLLFPERIGLGLIIPGMSLVVVEFFLFLIFVGLIICYHTFSFLNSTSNYPGGIAGKLEEL